MVSLNSLRKTAPKTHPAIEQRAAVANQRFNDHMAYLREMGYTKQQGIPMELSVLAVETASIMHDLEGLKNGE